MKKTFFLILCLTGIAAAQNHQRMSISPIAAASRYVLDDQITVGPMIGLRLQSREFESNVVGIQLGAILKPNGVVEYGTEPFIYSNPQPLYRFQPPLSSRIVRQSRYELGMGFVGFDWRTYLADGEIRPYVGVGASLVGWSSENTFTGTVSPDVEAGLDIHLSRGINAFAEAQYLFGSPTLFGSRVSRLNNITSLAFGVSFAPRW